MSWINFNRIRLGLYITLGTIHKIANDEIITKLRELIDDETDRIIINSRDNLVIDQDIFSSYLGKHIKVTNIIFTSSVLAMIPDYVKYFETDIAQESVHLLKVDILHLTMPEGQFLELPKSAISVSITLPRIVVNTRTNVYCSDNLKRFTLFGDNATINLMNCNYLQELRISGRNSFVYGVEHYLFGLRLNVVPSVEYIRRFTALKSLRSDISLGLDIDDIPNTLEILDTKLTSNGHPIYSTDILAERPNIKFIHFYEEMDDKKDLTPRAMQVIEEHPDTEFFINTMDTSTSTRTRKFIERHNSKAVALSELL